MNTQDRILHNAKTMLADRLKPLLGDGLEERIRIEHGVLVLPPLDVTAALNLTHATLDFLPGEG